MTKNIISIAREILERQERKMELFPFQIEGVKYLKENPRCLLLDEQGLGKTVQTVCACRDLSLRHILVITKSSLKIQWEREFRRFYSGDYELRIESYNYLQDSSKSKKLGSKHWDCVVADECQHVSNWSAKQTVNFGLHVIKNSSRVWLLSGTPATRYAGNWHPLLSMVKPGELGKFGDFCSKYCFKKVAVYSGKRVETWHGWKRYNELNSIIKKVSLRRLKKDVAKELPIKMYQDLYCAADSDLVADVLETVDYQTVRNCIVHGRTIPAHISKVRFAIGLSKIPICVDFCLERTKPLVVFAWHTNVINTLTSKLITAGKRCESIIGSDLNPLRQRVVDSFENGELDVLVLSIAACGVGLNLPLAETCVFLEMPWSYALMSQCEDRIHRITSKHSRINIVNILAHNTIDVTVKNVLEEKKKGMIACLS